MLLANGNLRESGDLPGGRHFAVWHDPWPKPSYLFALVGGKLGRVEDTLRHHVAAARSRCASMSSPARRTRAGYAMDSLKRSMRWDEEAFGREYDLDVFMIVAVSDFNMGAMENKGLNVFNDKYVLASPETATDDDFVAIEAIIAHEYFHNWTGNRITCRDWFQLCLKEGLTVFRDQEFTSDQRSRVVDAHRRRARAARAPVRRGRGPPRPSGAARALPRDQQLLHRDGLREGRRGGAHAADADRRANAFRKGMDLYFERHDGEAATVEQFVQCFADVSGRDLVAVHALVFAGRHAGGRSPPATTTRAAQDLPPRPRADAAADARPADQGADGHPAGHRPGRPRRARPAADACRRPAASSAACWCSTRPAQSFAFTGRDRAAGAFDQPRLLGADQARSPIFRPTTCG